MVSAKNQHGFIKGKSCLTELIALCGEVAGLVNKGGQLIAINLVFAVLLTYFFPHHPFFQIKILSSEWLDSTKWVKNCLNHWF